MTDRNLIAAREIISGRARADGEHVFAREVLAGCRDHRPDVQAILERSAYLEGYCDRRDGRNMRDSFTLAPELANQYVNGYREACAS